MSTKTNPRRTARRATRRIEATLTHASTLVDWTRYTPARRG